LNNKAVQLLDICSRLFDAIESDAGSSVTKDLVREFKARSEADARALAQALNVSDQTLYRWLSGSSCPRHANVKSMVAYAKEFAKDEDAEETPEPLRVSIGISKFWDMALIATFEQVFAAFNIIPRFVPLHDAWHSEANEAFDDGRIDVAIHNDFTVRYDKQRARSSGLTMTHPLFAYKGHHIFVNQAHLKKYIANPLVAKLINGDIYELGLYDVDGKDTLRLLLSDARIGVERGTDLEMALRKAYSLASLDFPPSEKINCDDRGIAIGAKSDAFRVTTNEALQAFLKGTVDIFCGGWQQFYRLYREQTPILLGPEVLDITSLNGLVATEKYANANAPLLNKLAKVWFTGIQQFERWTEEASQLDGIARTRALSELGAVLTAVEPNTKDADEDRVIEEGILPSPAFDDLVAFCCSREAPRPDTTEVTEPCKQRLITHLEEFIASDRKERERRISKWATVMCKYDDFYKSLKEAREAESTWRMNTEIQEIWDTMQAEYAAHASRSARKRNLI
jgi:hypothetical protein